MKLYKSLTNEIFAYEEDGSQDHIIPEDYVAVTNEQADLIIATRITAEQNKLIAIGLLQATDWAMASDVADTSNNLYLTNQADFAAYRDAVRQHAVYPTPGIIIWPTLPQAAWVTLT
jgi:hypothetical protein